MRKLKSGNRWVNWSETADCLPSIIRYPSNVEQVCQIVKKANDSGRKIRVVGAGHSFTELVSSDDILISLDLLNGISEVNDKEMTVKVFAGTRLYQLGEELGKLGFSQENLGDINVQSIAGAISTGTHGTGIQFGNISTQVVELSIVNGKGEVVNLSETENAKYFKAALVSLGLLGIIVNVKLRIIERPVYMYKSKKVDFSSLIEQFDSYISNNRHFEFYLFPFSDLAQVKTMNITEQKPVNLRFYKLKNLILENYLFYITSEICRLKPSWSSLFSRLAARTVGSDQITGHNHDLFATERLVKFREMEYCIPLQYAKKAIWEVKQLIEEKKYKVHFPIECRTVQADDIWLSPSYQRDSFFIAFHMYKGMEYKDYFRDMEAIMKKYEGRPHWGKLHSRTSGELKDIYSKLPDFLDFRKQMDPNQLFVNEYLDKLVVGENGFAELV